MKKDASNNSEIKNPEPAATELGAISNNTQIDFITKESESQSPQVGGREGERRLSPITVQDAAKDYIQRGWYPLPVPYQKKAPAIIRWGELRLKEADVPQYFNDEPQNIGFLLGEPSGELVDIDLDAREAIQLADEFLPETKCIFGRASKPRSHRVYISNPAPATIKYSTAEGLTLVEIRSTGAQTIFPPSVHQDGEQIEFVQDDLPSTINAEDLEKAVARLAAASLLMRHWPKQGTRQDTAMALAGGLARAGWEQKEIQHFILTVAKAAGDEEAGQRANCTERTANRAQSDDPVTGWPRLAELIGDEVVKRLREWVGPEESIKDQVKKIRRSKQKESDKNRQTSAIVIQALRELGIFYRTPYELYYFDQQNTRLFPLTDAEFRARMNDRFDINGTETVWKFVLEDLHKEALLRGQETTIHRFAFYEREKGILYVYKGQEKVFRITSEGWSVVPNGTEGILFLNPDMEPVEISPVEADSGAVASVINIPNFDGSGNLTSKQESQLYRLWVYSLFFESLLPTKPILLLIGIKGSGKTMGLRALLRALFGKKAQVLTLSKDNKDAFEATVTSHHLVAFDNLDGEIPWLANHLAIAATGGDIPKRKLYTTNEFVSYPVRCFLALTSREPDSMSRDDVADRLLTLKVDRIASFKPESQFLGDIDVARPIIWSELLRDLQRIISMLQTGQPHVSSHRLADFASLAMNIGPVLGIKEEEVRQLLEGMDSEKADFALEHNPLYPLLVSWLEGGGMGQREWIDSKTLFDEMEKQQPFGSRFPYKNAGVLSRSLKNLKTELQGWIEVIGPERRPGGNNKSSWQIRQGPKLVLTPKEEDKIRNID